MRDTVCECCGTFYDEKLSGAKEHEKFCSSECEGRLEALRKSELEKEAQQA